MGSVWLDGETVGIGRGERGIETGATAATLRGEIGQAAIVRRIQCLSRIPRHERLRGRTMKLFKMLIPVCALAVQTLGSSSVLAQEAGAIAQGGGGDRL